MALKEDFSWIRAPHELHLDARLVRGEDDLLIDVPKGIAYNFQELHLLAKGSALKASFHAEDKMDAFFKMDDERRCARGFRSDQQRSRDCELGVCMERPHERAV